MNIDFHTHVKIAKKAKFVPEYFHSMVTEAKAAGLDALAVTEHYNALNFLDVYEYLDAHFPLKGDYYEVEGLKLFPGMEVDVKEAGHILLISRREIILDFFHKLKPYGKKEDFIPLSDLMHLAESLEIIKIGAHPFRPSTPLAHLNPNQLARLDAFELNGKDLHSLGIEDNQQNVLGLAEALGLPVVAGSDTHQFFQYGSVFNRFNHDCSTITEIKTAIENKAFSIQVSPDLNLRVRSASLTRKLMKKLLGAKKKNVS
jgi:histidinol phosphatase-like PHP family hydrolase